MPRSRWLSPLGDLALAETGRLPLDGVKGFLSSANTAAVVSCFALMSLLVVAAAGAAEACLGDNREVTPETQGTGPP